MPRHLIPVIALVAFTLGQQNVEAGARIDVTPVEALGLVRQGRVRFLKARDARLAETGEEPATRRYRRRDLVPED